MRGVGGSIRGPGPEGGGTEFTPTADTNMAMKAFLNAMGAELDSASGTGTADSNSVFKSSEAEEASMVTTGGAEKIVGGVGAPIAVPGRITMVEAETAERNA